MTIARVLAHGNTPLTKTAIRKWFPDHSCVFSDWDYEFMAVWYENYQRKSTKTGLFSLLNGKGMKWAAK